MRQPAVLATRHALSLLVAFLLFGLAPNAVVAAGPPTSPAAKPPVEAALPPGDGDPAPSIVYFQQGILTRSGEVVEALGPDLMGDAVNGYSGGLQFTHTDVALPGNNGLPVRVGRHKAVGTTQAYAGTGLFADWDLDIPHLHMVAAQNEPNWYGGRTVGNLNRCSQFADPPGTTSYYLGKWQYNLSFMFWDGNHLYVPGQGDQTLLARGAANTIFPSDGTAAQYPVVTKGHWQLKCLPTLDTGVGGEGFEARAPDGTRYRFDHLAVRSYPRLSKIAVSRVEVWILPTLITDRFGNWVRYTYGGADGWRVTSITSSDGRAISFTYSGWGNRVQSVSDGTRTWTYGYNATTGRLQNVTLPDGSQWTFAIDALSAADPWSAGDPACDTDTGPQPPITGSITHPSGAVGTFTLTTTVHGRSGVPGSACHPGNRVGRFFTVRSLTSKTLSGPGMPAMTWTYGYSVADGSYAPCNGCVNTKTVTITDPMGNVTVNTYGTQYAFNEGLLLNSAEGVIGGAALRSTAFTYRASNAGPYPANLGSTNLSADSMSNIHTPQASRTITQQGVAFTQTATAFDIYARTTALTRSSGLGYSRSESITYYDQTSLWVLGQSGSRVIAGLTASSTSFNSATALPSAHYKFGKLHASYTFNADGTLYRITDGLNQSTTYTNYVRGIPQNIAYADGTSMSAVVNNIGVITSVTNEAAATWTYGYDAMGRLASKTPPIGLATTLSFVQVPFAEVGLEANHWRQTITTGNAVTVNYFDARWRKRLTTTYDAANRAATESAQRFDHDPYNRVTFAAYPARSIASIATAVPGTVTIYDALGRPTQTRADSELGVLTTNTAYLGGFQKQVTNARGYATIQAFQAFDEPSEDAIATVWAPEGSTLSIARDAFGKPLSITRSGSYGGGTVSATRSYVYDGNQLLCKTIEPETGATVQQLDAANNVAWRASGLGLANPTTCDWSSVPANLKVSFGYDARNRMTGTAYGDGSPGIGRSYTADGLPNQVWSGGSTWTYGYDAARRLVSESMLWGSYYNFQWGRDAYGHVSSLTYPTGLSVSYAPNALGQPTQVSGFASNVSYWPNGAIAGYTLANGVAHSTTQNTRGLPALWRDAGVVQDAYSYDANANVTAIGDQQEGLTSRSMAYDGLDRLSAANGIWGAGSFGYDPLDNLRTSTVGARSLVHGYDAGNRLVSLSGSQNLSLGYDANGNLVQRGAQGYAFDIGNRLQSAAGKASYAYDGHGRRVQLAYADGSWRLQFYGQGGQLLLSRHSSQGYTAHVYLGERLIAESNDVAGLSYSHTDALGSPVARTNSLGQLLSRTRYEPYGATTAGTNPTGIGFTGHANDADTGLVYMQQRYYDPVAGRFLSVDPVTASGANGALFNRYMYGANNPYRYIDPDGRCTGSRIENKDGTCASTGGFTTDSAGLLQGMQLARQELAAAVLQLQLWVGNAAASGAEGLDDFQRTGLGHALQGLPPEGLAIGGVKAGLLFVSKFAAKGTRAINLPGWGKVTVDMQHIAERHMIGGALTEGRSVFANLNERGVMAAIRQAYGSATTVTVQGERVLLSGVTNTGMTVEMWLNRTTNVIETAYPVAGR